ncbi:hypothetical protein M433DRAFT_313061 [Acidomyces richmondensis BFW]|nr:MAG: hypothetical protein FE78DRAFT_68905 [Acidomyces sp. 'richmondensis']KYG44252.1 hypothetical protein M433DRAFT_313061 [Acidomyces richmondensis BFW]
MLLETLPADVRKRIYEYVLTRGEDVRVSRLRVSPVGPYGGLTCKTQDCRPGPGYGFVKPALLSVCKQIREEATPIFYACNNFRILICDEAQIAGIPFVWLKSLTVNEKKALKRLVLEFHISSASFTRFQKVLDGMVAADPNRQPGNIISQQVEALNRLGDLRRQMKLEIPGLFAHALLRVRKEGQDAFNLEKLTLEAGKSGSIFDRFNDAWTGILTVCLRAVREGREPTFGEVYGRAIWREIIMGKQCAMG